MLSLLFYQLNTIDVVLVRKTTIPIFLFNKRDIDGLGLFSTGQMFGNYRTAVLTFFLVLVIEPCFSGGEEVYKECRKEGAIAFTYDQGPSLYTGVLLTALNQANVKATFHVVPDYLDNPVLSANLRRAALEGHLIGVFVREGVEEANLKAYLSNASSILKQYVNYQPQWLRFAAPGPTPAMLKTVTSLGYRVTGYNLDSLDYQYASDAVEEGGKGPIFQTVKNVLDLIVPPTLGSFIMVQRDIVQTSVLQTAAILKYAKERGYKGVRLDECVGMGVTIQGEDGKNGDGMNIDDGTTGGRRKNEASYGIYLNDLGKITTITVALLFTLFTIIAII